MGKDITLVTEKDAGLLAHEGQVLVQLMCERSRIAVHQERVGLVVHHDSLIVVVRGGGKSAEKEIMGKSGGLGSKGYIVRPTLRWWSAMRW